MIVIPAIDIINGKPVRLYQGDYVKSQQVAESILDTALAFEKAGAKRIHMIDLDGAKQGKRINHEYIVEVCRNVNVPVEVGGGIRNMDDVDFYLDNGVSKVILGTSAIQDQTFLKEAISKYKDRIIVGMDCKNGYVMVEGWLKASEISYLDFAKQLEEIGVSEIIFTDISKDGTLMGPNLEMLQALKDATSMKIIASGGIKDLTHIKQLSDMNLFGCITGKAIYSETLDLTQAIQEGEL